MHHQCNQSAGDRWTLKRLKFPRAEQLLLDWDFAELQKTNEEEKSKNKKSWWCSAVGLPLSHYFVTDACEIWLCCDGSLKLTSEKKKKKKRCRWLLNFLSYLASLSSFISCLVHLRWYEEFCFQWLWSTNPVTLEQLDLEFTAISCGRGQKCLSQQHQIQTPSFPFFCCHFKQRGHRKNIFIDSFSAALSSHVLARWCYYQQQPHQLPNSHSK